MQKIIAVIFWAAAVMPATAGPLSKADWQREAAFLTIHAIDWGQTLDISQKCQPVVELVNPDNPAHGAYIYEPEKVENNPILGDCPSRGEVNTYFAASALLHTGITYLLPAGKPREYWQYLTITVSGTVVARNYQIGLSVNF